MLLNLDVDGVGGLALALAALLATARLLGHFARRAGIAPVVGELAAGVLLGPSVLGVLAPAASDALVPTEGTERVVLDGLAWVGVVLLLASVGARLDLPRVGRQLRGAPWLPVMSWMVPLATGMLVGWSMPASFLGDGDRAVAAAFVGVALVVSALPTIARALGDLGLLRRDVGQLTVGAAALDDIVGWFLLAVLTTGAAGGGLGDVALTVGQVLAFMALAWLGGTYLVDMALAASVRLTETVAGPITTAFVAILAVVAVASAFDVDAVVGALVAGILLGSSPAMRPGALARLDELTTAILGPLFFALAGAALDLGALGSVGAAGWVVVLVVAAVASKVGGAFLGATMSGLDRRVGLAVGLGLSTRGGLGVVVAAVGASEGVLSPAGYAAIVVVAVVTSLLAPGALVRAVARVPTDPEERARIARQDLLATSPVVGSRRVLLLTRGGANSRVAARVLDLTLDASASVTVLLVADGVSVDQARATGDEVAALLGHRQTRVRVVESSEVAKAILAEADRGHDLLVAGASGEVQAPAQLGTVLADVLIGSSVPVMLVRSRTDAEGLQFRRVLTAAPGTAQARAAQDVAFALGRFGGADVDIVHVIARSDRILHASWFRNADRQPAPRHLLEEAIARGVAFEVEAQAHTRVGSAAAEELLAAAHESHADTLVLATSTRALADRPFLGHGVEFLLEHAPQNLVIVSFPVAHLRTDRG